MRKTLLVFAALAAIIVLAPTAQAGGGGLTGYVPTTPEVKHWIKSWCSVKPGMTRAQARRIMGRPTSEWTMNQLRVAKLGGFDPQMGWSAYQYSFSAYFDINDRVRQADGDSWDLTKADRRAIRCVEARVAR